jgi:hypothetical protein
MSCVLACALCGGRVGGKKIYIYIIILCFLLVFISNYKTMHGVEQIKKRKVMLL